MKNLLFVASIICLLMFAGCGKTTPTVAEQSTGTLTASGFLLCMPENLVDTTIIVMDDVVKHCTEKKEEGLFIEGLWWVFPEYDIMNDSIVIAARDNEVPDDIVACQAENWAKYIRFDSTWYTNGPLFGYDVFPKVFGKWLLNQIANKVYPDNMRCNEKNTDCTDMMDYGWRTDGMNYFVAGFRTTFNQDYTGTGTNPDRLRYYAINDRVYFPWEDILGRGVITESKRNFVGIQDNKIIVRRMKDSVVIWDPDTTPVEQLKSTFTLETCEIDL